MKFDYSWPSAFEGDVWNCQNMMRVLGQTLKNDFDLFYSHNSCTQYGKSNY